MNNLEATDRWLPTSIANETGWMILNDQEIEITWNGGKSPSDLLISGREVATSSRVVSQFGNGIATWRLPFLLRLPVGINVRLRGPTNWHREGAFPIEQILDAGSCDVGVSISWKVTAIGIPVRFEVGEPLCMIYPELRGLADEVDPQVHPFDGEVAAEEHASSLNKSGEAPRLSGRTRQGREESEVNESARPTASQGEVSDRLREQAEEVGPNEEIGGLSLGTMGQSSESSAPSNYRSRPEPFCVQSDFYDQAATLRNQFERIVLSATSTDPTANPLTYAYSENAYHFIAATAERIFSADQLFSLLDRLRVWARERLGATHASTPRVQIYTRGSYRHFAMDDIRVGWHYLFSVTRDEKRTRRVNVLLESASEILDGFGLGVRRVARVKLSFNELLVHDAKRAYAIDGGKGSTNPSEALVLLDGYLW